MRQSIVVALVVGSVTLAGCAYPVSSVVQGAPASAIYFPNAEPGTLIYVDGASAGEAIGYDGKKAVLVVSTGMHHVVLRRGEINTYDGSVFVGSGSRISIRGGQK